MDWKAMLPGFDEKYAKVKIRPHKKFGGKVYEVIYGAVDEAQNPVMASEEKEDGHGRWYGIECDGTFTMFSWKHPACEGGALEYGTEFKDDALDQLENGIDAKQELCREAETAVNSNAADAEAKLADLKAKYDAMHDFGTPKEKESNERFAKACEQFGVRAEAAKANAAEKQKLVDKAAELKESTKWKDTQQAFRDLQDSWEQIGSAGAQDDDLWQAFSSARREFNDRRRAYFDNLDTVRAEAKQKKEALIEEAKKVAANVTSYKAAADQMNQLMDSWKAAGSAGHDTDEELWKGFNEARQVFYDARRKFFDEREAARKASVAAKKSLIAEAKELTSKGDYSKEITERMKQLDKEWKAAGYCGKEEGDKLWNEFKTAKEAFWDGKHSDSQKRFQDALARKEAKIEETRSEINSLQVKSFETEDYDRIHSLERQIEAKKALMENLKQDVEELKKKIEPADESSDSEEN